MSSAVPKVIEGLEHVVRVASGGGLGSSHSIMVTCTLLAGKFGQLGHGKIRGNFTK